MAFHLKKNEATDKGIKRVIRNQLDSALAELTEKNAEAVHDVRVHFKKIRACLRLERAALGNKIYHHENRYFRDVAHPLRQVRDAEIMIETLDKLELSEARGVRSVLQERHAAMRHRVLEERHVFNSLAQAVKDVRGRLKDWPDKKSGWPLLRAGLKHGYRQNRYAFTHAVDRPTNENLHEWRKQVKYLWYQLGMLERVWPKKMKNWDRQFHQLSQLLGDDHDLALLRSTLTKDKDIFNLNTESLNRLLTAIDRKRVKLQRQAFALGKQLYHCKAGKFTGTIHNHWKKWRQ